MKYALVKNQTALQYKDFGTETPPVLAENKGAWLPVIEGEHFSYTDDQIEYSVEYEESGEWLIAWLTRAKTPIEMWDFPDFGKRIIAPKQMIFSEIGLQMKSWFDLEGLPVKRVGEFIHLYCNEILTEHQTIVNQLAGQITIENKPIS